MDNYETLLNKLANLLNQQEDKRKLHEIENKIFLDKDALKLITNYQKAQEDYNFAIGHFSHEEKIVEKYQKLLVNAKRKMDLYPAIEEYNKLYLKISEPTLYLEKEIHKILDLKDHEKC